jgi:hypothetical protein
MGVKGYERGKCSREKSGGSTDYKKLSMRAVLEASLEIKWSLETPGKCGSL